MGAHLKNWRIAAGGKASSGVDRRIVRIARWRPIAKKRGARSGEIYPECVSRDGYGATERRRRDSVIYLRALNHVADTGMGGN